MKKLLFIALLLTSCTLSEAQKDSEGFVSIFDGKSLKHWKVNRDNPDSYSVQDGMLIVKGGKSHIFYMGKKGKASYKNFELKLKARTKAGANSGVYFHTEYQDKGWPKIGFEAQVNSTHTDPKKTGSLYGIANIYAPKDTEPYTVRVAKNREIFMYQEKAPSTDDEWFDYHIIVQDDRIILKVNGHTTVDWTQPKDWTKTRRIGKGTIAIQAHDPNSETHYKDIRIKVMD